jgi:hypothetical protein
MGRADMVEISEDILWKTTQCTRALSCLNGESDCLCEVEQRIGAEVLFVRCMNGDCSYRVPFGYGCVCTCPVRMEMYVRYDL